MIRLFSGFDTREEAGYHTFVSSVIHKASKPVSITPLHMPMFPQGTNAFTYSRFLVPWLCDFRGHAIFADGCDMVMNADIAELEALFDPAYPVQVVKNTYKTKHPLKYIGTDMMCPNRNYERKNWASLMLINCEHPQWAGMTPETVEVMAAAPMSLLQFKWGNLTLGELPKEWNWLADEYGVNHDAKIIHYTAGIPGFPKYADTPMANYWFDANANAHHASP